MSFPPPNLPRIGSQQFTKVGLKLLLHLIFPELMEDHHIEQVGVSQK